MYGAVVGDYGVLAAVATDCSSLMMLTDWIFNLSEVVGAAGFLDDCLEGVF
jgi:hypothetical protein